MPLSTHSVEPHLGLYSWRMSHKKDARLILVKQFRQGLAGETDCSVTEDEWLRFESQILE